MAVATEPEVRKAEAVKPERRQRQWHLRYRGPKGPVDTAVEAGDLATAILVGQKWCEKRGYRYVYCVDDVVATEEILKD